MNANAETKQESVLRKVRALLAKANSTTFEGERQTFLNKADELMTKFAIDEAMLKLKDDPNARLVIRKDTDFGWWWSINGMDTDARSEIYWLWEACVRHCRCVTGGFGTSDGQYENRKMPVFGTPSDLNYLDLLFTDLFMQMSAKLKPAYDPQKTLGHNIALAKAAGYKWAEIAVWSGHPEWVVDGKPKDNGVMKRYYLKHLADTGEGASRVDSNPRTYQWSYVSGFCSAVKNRLRLMSAATGGGEGESSGMAIAIRDIRDQARDLMWNEFPDLRPHPEGCECDSCKPKKTKAVKLRSRTYNYTADGVGREAGKNARIASNAQGVTDARKRDQLT